MSKVELLLIQSMLNRHMRYDTAAESSWCKVCTRDRNDVSQIPAVSEIFCTRLSSLCHCGIRRDWAQRQQSHNLLPSEEAEPADTVLCKITRFHSAQKRTLLRDWRTVHIKNSWMDKHGMWQLDVTCDINTALHDQEFLRSDTHCRSHYAAFLALILTLRDKGM